MSRHTRTREAPEVRRARILDQAFALIGERGYYGFTIQELARRSGLSNPGLLHYFPSKPEVLLAVLAELEVREAEVVEPLVHMAERELVGAEANAAVLSILHAMIARAVAQPQIVRLLVELQAESLDPDHPAHEWWQRRETILLDFLVRLLKSYFDNPQPIARQVMATMDGLAMQWLRANCTFDAAAEWQQVLARLLPELHPNGT
jgi:AcrR family transcriptional regulator